MKFDVYDPQNGPFYDETFAAQGVPRPGFEPLVNGINALEPGSLLMRQAAAERALLSMGITFTLYGDGGSAERIFPFDVIPRVVGAKEWERYRSRAASAHRSVNLFRRDVYGGVEILKDKVVPEALVKTCADAPAVHRSQASAAIRN